MQEVSVRGTGGAIFAGTLLVIGGVLWMLQGIAGIVKGTSYIQSANYWITTSAST
jgi:TRAP-type mannitol/chloroaromatic compound transport system permease small subunit